VTHYLFPMRILSHRRALFSRDTLQTIIHRHNHNESSTPCYTGCTLRRHQSQPQKEVVRHIHRLQSIIAHVRHREIVSGPESCQPTSLSYFFKSVSIVVSIPTTGTIIETIQTKSLTFQPKQIYNAKDCRKGIPCGG
jgi:hypothetical protein